MDIDISQDDGGAWGLSKKLALFIKKIISLYVYHISKENKYCGMCLKPARNQDESKENQIAGPRES